MAANSHLKQHDVDRDFSGTFSYSLGDGVIHVYLSQVQDREVRSAQAC